MVDKFRTGTFLYSALKNSWKCILFFILLFPSLEAKQPNFPLILRVTSLKTILTIVQKWCAMKFKSRDSIPNTSYGNLNFFHIPSPVIPKSME